MIFECDPLPAPRELLSGDFVVRGRVVRSGEEYTVSIPLDEENARYQCHNLIHDTKKASSGARGSTEYWVARMIYEKVP